MLGALCYVCVPKIDELTIWTLQLELGEFGPALEPLEFVSAALIEIINNNNNNNDNHSNNNTNNNNNDNNYNYNNNNNNNHYYYYYSLELGCLFEESV